MVGEIRENVVCFCAGKCGNFVGASWHKGGGQSAAQTKLGPSLSTSAIRVSRCLSPPLSSMGWGPRVDTPSPSPRAINVVPIKLGLVNVVCYFWCGDMNRKRLVLFRRHRLWEAAGVKRDWQRIILLIWWGPCLDTVLRTGRGFITTQHASTRWGLHSHVPCSHRSIHILY